MARKHCNAKPFYGKLWQRNYWEHIFRNENEYNRISQYIIVNPVKWDNNKLNGETAISLWNHPPIIIQKFG